MKHRRALTLLALIVLAAVTQCGCVLGHRDAPPAGGSHSGALPIQAELIWGVMFGILGVGVGAFMLAELPFKRLGWSVIVGSLAIIVCCLVVAWVAAHIVWIIIGATAIGALSFLWCKMRLKDVAKRAWDIVPETAPSLGMKAESLLNKLT